MPPVQETQCRHPRIVAVGGFSGSGKSAISSKLATELYVPKNALLIRSDYERKEEFGVTELKKTHYTNENSARVYNRIYKKVEQAIGAGHKVVVDATFAREHQRIEINELAHRHDIDFFGLWLMAPISTLRHRINSTIDGDTSVLEKQLRMLKGKIDWWPIDTAGTIEHSVEEIINRIKNR